MEGSEALVLDTIKRGEDDEDVSRGELPVRKGRSIVIRIYESLGGRARGFVRLGDVLRVKNAYHTNVLEDDEGEVELSKDRSEAVVGFVIELKPFQVKTFRLQL